jgi:hypothetical protein
VDDDVVSFEVASDPSTTLAVDAELTVDGPAAIAVNGTGQYTVTLKTDDGGGLQPAPLQVVTVAAGGTRACRTIPARLRVWMPAGNAHLSFTDDSRVHDPRPSASILFYPGTGNEFTATASAQLVVSWVDARVSLSPTSGTSLTGASDTYSATVEVNDGGGWDPAPTSR